MQSQTSTLDAACQARSRKPWTRCVIEDRTLRWAMVHQHDTYTSSKSVAACTGINDPQKIIRLMVDGTNLKCNVVSDVDTVAQWWSWTTIKSGVILLSDCAIGHVEGEIFAFFWIQGATYKEVHALRSNDDGASWSGEHALYWTTTPAPNYALATSGNDDCWIIQGASYVVTVKWRSGGTWSAPKTSGSNPFGLGTDHGMAVAKEGANDRYCITMAVEDASGNYWLECMYYNGISDVWQTAPHQILPTGSAVSYLELYQPSIIYAADGNFHVSVCERWYDGTNDSVTYSIWRNVGGWAANNYCHWGVPVALDVVTAARIRTPLLERDDDSGKPWLWAAAQYEILRAKEYDAGDANHKLTSDQVLAFHLETGETTARGWIDLANTRNQFANWGQDGEAGAPLKRYAQVKLDVGYQTSAGDEYKQLPTMWLETAEMIHGLRATARYGQRTRGPSSRLRLHVIGLWRVLEAWAAPYELSWSTTPARTLIRDILAKAAGVETTDDGSNAWLVNVHNLTISEGRRQDRAWRWREEWIPHDDVPVPIYQVDEGTTGLEVIWKLCRLAGGNMAGNHGAQASLLDIKAQNSDTDYLVGSNDEIEAAAYGQALPGVSRARIIYNSSTNAIESVDAQTAMDAGRLIETIETRNELTTAANADEMAEGITHRGAALRYAGWIRIPIVPGLELYDRLDIVDSRAGFASGDCKRRAISIAYDADLTRSRYHMRVGLQAL